MDSLWIWFALTPEQYVALSAIALAAGVVRGFTGFALSAFALAIAVMILPPVELIPVMWWLELGASILMVRGGFKEANNRAVIVLVVGTTFGLMVGLSMTLAFDPNVSRLVALVVLIALAALQLANVRMAFLGTRAGTIITGLVAGLVTGLAGIGGMVVALFVLAREAPPRQMRATLVMFLFLSSFTSLGTHIWFGTMNTQAVLRGMSLMPICMVGVLLGARLFMPRFEPYYKPICLILLVGLACMSILRTAL